MAAVERNSVPNEAHALKFFAPTALLAGLLFFAGCVTEPKPVPLTGNIMIDGPMMLTNGPPQDKALWEYRTAASAMYLGRYDYAKQLLDSALLTAGGISMGESAKKARSYFHPESTKVFIGEPYERVMAYYYRGILYWMDGEPDNARACFRSAAIQDADAEKHEYASDYVVLDYLDGLASLKLGDDGSDAYRRATNEVRRAMPPAYDPKANVLFFLEFDPGPYKFATGKYHQELRFGVPPSRVGSVKIEMDGQNLAVGPYDDLFFQATTRGGRVMDHVLANKAVFKTTTSAIGTAAIVGGAIAATSNNHTSQQVGLGLLAVGLVSKIISGSTDPQADTRAWGNLPRYLSFAALEMPPGEHTVTVEFRDHYGSILSGLTKTINIHVAADGKDKVVFVSDRSVTPQTI